MRKENEKGNISFFGEGSGMTKLEKRFFSHVRKTKNCWVWLGGKVGKGYGGFWYHGCKRAHRVSYEIHFGEIPKGLMILHRCDNPSCVNPMHLVPGTAKDNAEDAVKRGHRIWSIDDPRINVGVEELRLGRE